jgi:SAM-dependent methyltransferase
VRLVRLINIVRDLVAGNYRPSPGVGPAVKIRRDTPPPLFIERFANQTDFQSYRARRNAEVAARRQRESELSSPEPRFKIPGFCFVCHKWTEFVSSWDFAHCVDGRLQLNWREQLRCPGCDLNNRMRASVHLLAEVVAPTRKSHIYATEQSTPLYRYLQKCFPRLVGSEYLEDGTGLGQTNSASLRNEDLTKLSFPDAHCDVILTFDVMEHIADYPAAVTECVRVLKPGGKMLFSVPFDAATIRNQVRARVDRDGTIEHLLAPEYHAHPRNPKGSLCFQRFGWEMFEQLRQAGFRNVWALCYYSPDYGYLGGEQLQFLAEK